MSDRNDLALTDKELELITDALQYARGECVTDREAANLRDVHMNVVEQWSENE